eukprot:scaffold105072_cov34-Phaeocystis_antarctica.AAC.1
MGSLGRWVTEEAGGAPPWLLWKVQVRVSCAMSFTLCNRLRLEMAIADTAFRAVAEKHRVDILLIKEALVLVGPERGLEFELGGKKFKVPPMLKVNPPPDK